MTVPSCLPSPAHPAHSARQVFARITTTPFSFNQAPRAAKPKHDPGTLQPAHHRTHARPVVQDAPNFSDLQAILPLTLIRSRRRQEAG